jgi:ribosome recycling factor
MPESNIYIDQKKEEFEKIINHFKKELSGLRTGRAQATLVENIQVEAYGAMTPLMQLASISVPDAQSISIEPWDKNIIKDIEKALNYANLGFSVVNAGDKLIAKIPPMTEENRKDLLKILNQKAEESKISIRQVRDDIKENILAAEKNKEITEDDKYKFLTDLDNLVSEYNKKIDELVKDKEQEIMKV